MTHTTPYTVSLFVYIARDAYSLVCTLDTVCSDTLDDLRTDTRNTVAQPPDLCNTADRKLALVCLIILFYTCLAFCSALRCVLSLATSLPYNYTQDYNISGVHQKRDRTHHAYAWCMFCHTSRIHSFSVALLFYLSQYELQ